MRKWFIVSVIVLLSVSLGQVHAQVVLGDGTKLSLNYMSPEEYTIGGVTFSGTGKCDLRSLSFSVGDKIKIPGDKIRKTIQRLSDLGLYRDNIAITATKIEGKTIFLDIYLEEMPRLSSFVYKGVKKTDIEEFEKKISMTQGRVVNENLKTVVNNVITDYYKEKGFYYATTEITETTDSLNPNFVVLTINVDKGKKVKVGTINVYGTKEIEPSVLRAAMKETKTKFMFQPCEKFDTAIVDFFRSHEKYKGKDLLQLTKMYFADRVRFRFKASKFDQQKYEDDKLALVAKMNELGYRDAYIKSDTSYILGNREMNIDIEVEEGQRYYFRNISWVGNTKYSSDLLGKILGINKGDVYNTALLEKNLNGSPDNEDVSSLYLDDGYLFFYALPIEVAIEDDSVDIEIRVREGNQATINKVTVSGNTRTSDNVILRELTTVPGSVFSRSDIIRSQRQLLQLGYFNQEKMNVIPKADEKTGTVDLEYVVEEANSDQFELSVGWGAKLFYGSAGITFNNFSTRKMFKKDAWTPIPSGDGQRVSFKLQVYSNYAQYYAFSFTEPWVGGKKPISLNFSVSHSRNASYNTPKTSANYYSMNVTQVTIGLSNRLKLPDDYFYMSNSFSYLCYNVNNYPYFILDTGRCHEISYTFSLGRNSMDAPIYPRTGSDMLFTAQFTPPYSLLNHKDYSDMTNQEKYKLLEFHKWKFHYTQYVNVVENLVIMARAKFGFLGAYNKKVGIVPFERFYMGGSGMTSSYMWDAREIVAMRGYSDESLSPEAGASIYQRFTLELRYPITLNPSATIYILGFLEAGNSWESVRSYQPFKMYRSAGVGVRVYLPMFGLLGLDWGYGFDDVPGNKDANKSQFHFSIGQSID
ncbi:MAG: BamA/TamA family outer membrane protein [Bacteroidales bacterium]|nr:BamA/TamA family outer membrane protein [Bacteroidales bacterium]